MTRKKKNRQRNVPGQQDNLQRQEREGADSREDAAAQERFAGTNESGVNDQQKDASGRTSGSFQGSSKQECSQGQGPVWSKQSSRERGTASGRGAQRTQVEPFGSQPTQEGAASSQLQGRNFPSESLQAPMATVRPKTKGRNRIGTPAVDTAEQEHLDSKHQISGSASEDLEASEEMCKILKHMGMLAKPKPVRRPDKGGIIGRPVKLLTNHFPVNIRTEPAQSCFQYDVEITPKPTNSKSRQIKLSAKLKRKVFKQFLRDNLKLGDKEQGFAYDGDKKAYSFHRIESIEKVEIEFGDEKEEKIGLLISMKIVGDPVDMSLISDYARKVHDSEKPQQVLDVCNTMYKAMLHGVGDFVTLKRAVFSRKFGEEVDLTGGLDLWFGYQPSFVMGSWKVYLQVDLTSKPFTKMMPVIKFAEEFLGKRFYDNSTINQFDLAELSKALSGYKIKLRHNQREKRIADIVRYNSIEKKFENSGKTVNVADYFRTTYNYNVKYRQLPLVRIDPKSKDTCFPMELCVIVGEQQWLRKLNRKQQDLMVRNTAMHPSERSQRIVKMVNQDTKPNDSAFFKNFNISVDPRMPFVNGRVLPGPPIYGTSGSKVFSENGKYFDRNLGFVKPARSLQGYVVACPKSLEYHIGPFHDAMNRQARSINWPQRGPEYCYNFESSQNAQQVFQQIGNDYKIYKSFNLVIIILWDASEEIYSMAKYIFDNEHKIPNQVLIRKTIDPPKPANISNILKKINAKLGGANVETFTDYLDIVQREFNYGEKLREVVMQYKEIFREPFMVFGADVTHPDSKDPGKPSIAAVVGSLNSTLTRYGAQVMVQRSRQEMISDLEEMFTTILKEFKRLTKNQVPQRILYYRDGVSEGQFTDVLIKELYAMQQACKKLNPNFTPKITFIVVNKRHKARFFKPVNNRPVMNADPGIQGTSRPAHYHVLYDDSNFKSDTLQAFTFALCHLYARCASAVSYPPPTYYAHHAAMRARHHASYLMKMYPDDSSSSSSSGAREQIEASPKLINFLNEKLRRELIERYPMYFI